MGEPELRAALGLPLDEGLAVEWRAYESILDTEDRLEALAAFREKRKPVFKGQVSVGRRPPHPSIPRPFG